MTHAEARQLMMAKGVRGSPAVSYFPCELCAHLRPLEALVEQSPKLGEARLVCVDTAWCEKARGFSPVDPAAFGKQP